MDILHRRPRISPVRLPDRDRAATGSDSLPTWRLNLMRVGYLVMATGLVVTKWPLLLDHASWELMEGTVVTMLVAMSVLALVGLRHPQRMLPILLFEVGWKLLWLGTVALPLWWDGALTGTTREQTVKVLWVVVVIAVVPWQHAVRQFVLASGERWR